LQADEFLRPFTGIFSVVLLALTLLTAARSAAGLAIAALFTARCLLTTLLCSLIFFSLICHVVPPVVR
jgi:hypothetical protein